jgi:large subunit ribosomal protein L18
MKVKVIKNSTKQRKTRIRKTIAKISDRPRLSVSRSNRYCYAQIVAVDGQTLLGVSEKAVKGDQKLSTMDSAKAVGLAIAKMALEKKIKTVVFDKGSLSYHGRVKAIAEGAREGGLQF